MEKIFFAFLDELAHSKQFKKSRENDLHLTPPPPLVGKIPDNSGLFLEEGFPKAESPALEATYKGETVVVVIDTGAELNCLDKNIAEKLGVTYKNSEIRANAAGDAKITVCGLTDSDFIIQTKFQEETVDINLQKTKCSDTGNIE